MPIKRIQLRGISRNPSDRMTSDGGCAESLNVRLDNQELAPVLPEDDVTEALGLPADNDKTVYYIHKCGNFTNYIGIYKIRQPGSQYNEFHFAYFSIDESSQSSGEEDWTNLFTVAIKTAWPKFDIEAVGNTLIIALTDAAALFQNPSSRGLRYLLFKDTQYLNLGGRIPVPKVTFTCESQEVTPLTDSLIANMSKVYVGSYVESFERALNLYEADADCTSFINEFTGKIYSQLQSQVVEQRNAGYFCKPVLAKVALRLYDGTYYDFMAPCLLTGKGTNLWFKGRDKVNSDGAVHVVAGAFELTNVFDVHMNVNTDFVNWTDVITSVELFISQDINTPHIGARPIDIYEHPDEQNYFAHTYKGAELENGSASFEEDMLNASVFYLLKSYRPDELVGEVQVKPISQDELFLKKTLPLGDSNIYSPNEKMMSYNNRLILSGAEIELPEANVRYNCEIEVAHQSGSYLVRTFFRIKDENGAERIVAGYDSGTAVYVRNMARAFLAYPNPRCYQVDIYRYDDIESVGSETPHDILHYKMKEHPGLNISYFFAGLDKSLVDSETASSVSHIGLRPNEDKTYVMRNRLYMSLPDNPFVFGFEGRATFSGDVLGIATVTKALSQGQFGQFPLYVFTSDGIWAETISPDGGLAASNPVSRDLALAGTICPIDQAIVFVTKKGVMMLSGSDIANISPFMTGKHYVIEPDVKTLLRNDTDWNGFMDYEESATDIMPLDSTKSFMEFMSKARCLYDYYGDRILFFSEDAAFIYVYYFAANTWHKMSYPDNDYAIPLNSYPQALASFGTRILDYTTKMDQLQGDDLRNCVIITRAFDLDAPDVRKAIKAIRVRGDFDKANVKYLLLGSMDGRSFGRLSSLRGASYKFFRIIVLAKLRPAERISWIDVDYETRFIDKLR